MLLCYLALSFSLQKGNLFITFFNHIILSVSLSAHMDDDTLKSKKDEDDEVSKLEKAAPELEDKGFLKFILWSDSTFFIIHVLMISIIILFSIFQLFLQRKSQIRNWRLEKLQHFIRIQRLKKLLQSWRKKVSKKFYIDQALLIYYLFWLSMHIRYSCSQLLLWRRSLIKNWRLEKLQRFIKIWRIKLVAQKSRGTE